MNFPYVGQALTKDTMNKKPIIGQILENIETGERIKIVGSSTNPNTGEVAWFGKTLMPYSGSRERFIQEHELKNYKF